MVLRKSIAYLRLLLIAAYQIDFLHSWGYGEMQERLTNKQRNNSFRFFVNVARALVHAAPRFVSALRGESCPYPWALRPSASAQCCRASDPAATTSRVFGS